MTPTIRQWAGPMLLLVWASVTFYAHQGEWAVDLSALYFAGNFFGEGDASAIYNRVYDTPSGLKWVALRDALGFEGKTLAPYIYPPWVAGVLKPIVTNIGPQAFYDVGYAINIGSMALCVLFAGKLFRPANMDQLHWVCAGVIILVVSFPATFSIGLNQPQSLVNAMTLGAILLSLGRFKFTAGGILAAAAAVKLSPAVFILIFLGDKNWRALAGFTIVGIAFLALNFWISPAGYTHGFQETIARIGDEVLLSRINHSIEAVIYLGWALLSGVTIPEISGYIWVPGPVWLDPLVKVMLLSTLAVALWVTRSVEPKLRLWLRFQLIAILAILLGPLGWTHYMILPLFALPAIGFIWHGGPKQGWIIALAFLLAFSTPAFVNQLMLGAVVYYSKFWGLFWIMLWLLALGAIIRRRTLT